MKEKRISFSQGHGSLSHNNRLFTAENVDPFRTLDNITFVCQPIGEAYEQLFAESTERYIWMRLPISEQSALAQIREKAEVQQ